VRVTVQLFARLREIAGAGEWPCDVASNATVADVWRAIGAAHPGLGEFTTAISAAVNEDFAPMTATVRDGDRVAFLPPVSGGAPTRRVDP
jgi:molybdopterin converting factor subunit 1